MDIYEVGFLNVLYSITWMCGGYMCLCMCGVTLQAQGHIRGANCSGCCFHPGAVDFPAVHTDDWASKIDCYVERITSV